MSERKIIDYSIAERKSVDDLTSCIKCCIEDGWQPIGSVHSRQAGSYDFFYQSLVKYEEEINKKSKDKSSEIKDFLNLDISNLNLSTRTKNVLCNESIYKIHDFTKLSPDFNIANMGNKSYMEVIIEIIKFMVKYED